MAGILKKEVFANLMTVGMLWTAFVMDLVCGDPRWFPHPVQAIGRLVTWLEALFRRWAASRRALKYWGVALTLTVVASTYLAAVLALGMAGWISGMFKWMLGVFLAYTTLAVKDLYSESWIVVKAVRQGDLEQARRLLARIVGRDTGDLGEEKILSAVIETVAENLSDGVTAPLFYLALGGVPLALAFKAVSTIDSMLGYRDEPYRDIGWFGARLDDTANFIPARISALLIVLGSMILGLDYRSAWRVWRRDARKHASPNAGHPEAAMAGALQVQLGGPASYFGRTKEKPYLGDPLVPVTVERAQQAERLLFLCSTLMVVAASMFL